MGPGRNDRIVGEKKKKKKALDYENHAIHMVQRLLVVSQLVCVKVT
jgi:hypothetical protein